MVAYGIEEYVLTGKHFYHLWANSIYFLCHSWACCLWFCHVGPTDAQI